MIRDSEARLALTTRALAAAALMVAVAASTAALTPAAPAPAPAPDLHAMLPDSFGDWRRVEIADAVLPGEIELKPGEAIAYRAYRDSLGRIVTLVAAYGPPLGDSVRLHRPESCYVAQGFDIARRSVKRLDLLGRRAAIVQLGAVSGAREESVSYALRIGGEFITSPSGGGFASLKRSQRSLDGALLRASTAGDEPHLFAAHEAFFRELAAALSPEARAILLGAEGGAS
jgi:EpsI family protein